ncbi:MAG: HNH endonuclease [Nitrospirota bacterium]|nr:HNH endonuclease [Nitrospirota bacterium]
MPRRPSETKPETIRVQLIELLAHFEDQLRKGDLRRKVLSLISAFHLLRDLGSSLIPREEASAARDRILAYFRKYPLLVIHGDELMVVSGIQDWPRRIRELRREYGWAIASGVTVQEMIAEDEINVKGLVEASLKPEEYILLDKEQDREAAHRWKIANDIRKKSGGVHAKILEFLRSNVGRPVTGEELRYVTNDKSEWARRVRELRTEQGWPILTRNTGRPDLPIGSYLLEKDRQSPAHDRKIPDPVRRAVLVKDKYTCQKCRWTHEQWNPSDPRHLELHHKEHHAKGGENTKENLITLCVVCHDAVHRKDKS